MKPIIVFILAAVQILHASGQSVDQAVSDAIDRVNDESILDNLVAVTSYEQTQVTLTNNGLQVTLKLVVNETICQKVGNERLTSNCSVKPTNPITGTCTCVVTYDNCVLQDVGITGCLKLLPPIEKMLVPFADSGSNSTSAGSTSAGSTSD